MAAARVGSYSSGGNTSGTSHATTNPQSPTAGNTLILAISGSVIATIPTLTVTGWTLMGFVTTASGSNGGGVWVFAKIAAGGDTAPTISASASINISWVMSEWSGLAATLISTGIPISGSATNAAGSQTLNQSRTSVQPNEFQFGALGGRGATTNPAVTWGGGLTADYNTSSGRTSMLKTSTGSIASAGGSMTGTMQVTNNQGNPADCFVMVPFNLAMTDKVPVGAAHKAVTARALAVGAVNKSETDKGTVVSGVKKASWN